MATKNEKEYGTRMRLIRLLLAVLERPYGYTKEQLALLYGVSKDTISGDLDVLRDAGFVLNFDENYRYAFAIEQPYKKLKDLLHFSEVEQQLLHKAIDSLDNTQDKVAERLKKKLASIYDFKRLGHAYLRKPYLDRLDLLEKAKQEERAVLLKGYRSSNSNEKSDRKVEAFHYNAAEDSLHAFDLDRKALRHFRISRIDRIEVLDEGWAHKGHHNIIRTDPFRIVDNQQVNVHIRLKIGAYNELVERFPLTEPHIKQDTEKNIFDFQCDVNSKFYGLTNFILGYHHQLVEIVSPDSLLDHLHNEIKKIQENLGVGK